MALKETHVSEYYTTPVCELQYPYLATPDTQFDDPGVYHVDFLMTDEMHTDFMKAHNAVLNKYIDANGQQNKQVAPSTAKRDPASGKWKVRAKMKSASLDRVTGNMKERRPTIYNADLLDISNEVPMMASGSTGAVQVLMSAYGARGKAVGVTYRLHAVQVVTVVEPELKDNKGFEKQASTQAPEPGFGFQAQTPSQGSANDNIAKMIYSQEHQAQEAISDAVADADEPDFQPENTGVNYGDF